MLLSRKKEKQKEKNSSGYFISLGAGKNQVNLINAAQRLGYQVIAIDKSSSAPGFANADLQMYCSIIEPNKILQNLQIDLPIFGEIAGIGCRSFGQAIYSSAFIAKHFSLPGPGLDNLHVFQDKLALKKLFHKLNIPTSTSFIFNEQRESFRRNYYEWERLLPLIVRPIRGHAKQGVRILEKIGDVRDFLEETTNLNEYIFDKYIEGREVTVLGFVNHKQFILVSITEKHMGYHSSHLLEHGHTYPFQIESEVREKICTYLQKICDTTNLNHTPIVAEFILSDFDETMPICMIECSPETGGEYIADYLIPTVFNESYFQDLVRVYTGEKINIDSKYTQAKCQVGIRFIPQKNGKLKYLKFPDAIHTEENLIFMRYLKKTGEHTSLLRGNLDRLAVFGMKAPLEEKHLQFHIEKIVKGTIIEYE